MDNDIANCVGFVLTVKNNSQESLQYERHSNNLNDFLKLETSASSVSETFRLYQLKMMNTGFLRFIEVFEATNAKGTKNLHTERAKSTNSKFGTDSGPE